MTQIFTSIFYLHSAHSLHSLVVLMMLTLSSSLSCSLNLDFECPPQLSECAHDRLSLGDLGVGRGDADAEVEEVDMVERLEEVEDPRYETLSCDEACEIQWVGISRMMTRIGDEQGAPDEQPTVEVMTSLFQVSQSEVTVGQYSRCVADGVCPQPIPPTLNNTTMGTTLSAPVMTSSGHIHADPNSSFICNWFIPKRMNHPMNCLTLCEAILFAQWAGGRLLSEVEWEGLAQDEGRFRFPWGDDPISCDRAHLMGCQLPRDESNIEEIHAGDGPEAAIGVGTLSSCSLPNGLSDKRGLCDQIGNVYEWVADQYHPSYEGRPTGAEPWDPIEDCSEGKLGVVRGGSWRTPFSSGRSSNRTSWPSNDRSDQVGFRVAKVFF